MSSLTIDQLKKSLTEQGVALPPSGAKKAEYLRLYEQHNALNDALGDNYSSDDDIPLKNSSQNVTSSSSPGKQNAVSEEVQALSDDELYSRLVKFGVNIGPVLVNTRRVYEKKLIKLISLGAQSNGIDTVNSHNENANDEFSDSDVEVLATKIVKKKDHKEKRTASHRESPKPSMEEPELSSEKHSNNDYISKSLHTYGGQSRSSKISFIETIPKGSAKRYIDPSPELGYQSNSTFRSRFSLDKPSSGLSDYYSGTWEPNVSKYTGASSKISSKASASQGLSLTKKLLGGVGIAVLLFLAVYVYYQWSATDPYTLIEEDAQKEVKNFEARSEDKA